MKSPKTHHASHCLTLGCGELTRSLSETIVTIPQLTTEQLQAARAAATEARRRRAGLKQQVRTGELSLATALDLAGADEVLAHVKVADLLKAPRRVRA